jgi:hypothetical protein
MAVLPVKSASAVWKRIEPNSTVSCHHEPENASWELAASAALEGKKVE